MISRGALDADLRRYYQADLPDVREGKLCIWRVAAWAEHLPLDSASARAQDNHNWTRDHFLLANVFDALNIANWQRANVGVPAFKQSPAPEPLERPGLETEGSRERKIKATAITTAKLLEFKRRNGR